MNKKPEIAEPESDGLVLMSCLDLPEGLMHRHAQSVLRKYSQPDDLAIQIIRGSREKVSDTVLLMDIRQALYNRVCTTGTDEELRSLFVELFDKEKPHPSDN